MQSSTSDLALGIVDFLQQQIHDGSLPEDDVDSVEVAIQCLSDVFKVDLDRRNTVLGQQSLLSIFQAFEKVRDSRAKAAADTTSTPEPAAAAPAAPTAADKEKAEVLKGEGNRFVAQRDYKAAIDAYTKAIALDPTNKIYYSNRAAAYSSSGQHELAVADAESALAIDVNYAKAYSRLGLAKFALGDAEAAMAAYGKGIEIEGNGGSDFMRRGYETAKARVEEDLESAVPEDTSRAAATTPPAGGAGGFPDLSSLAGMFGGGAGGAGGMDFGSLMNNPQIAQMAQQFMSNPGAMQGLLNNPSVRSMADRFRGGNMPSMQEMMNDPNIANLARSFMGNNEEQ
ncbi:hypothetical protein V1512DRAFT_269613 [Lipomyces arxii]|uniref:uncharacterized protein n=1 Tax=Lipomyces arxii TaxID=56418 RepID=UPI0034CFE3A4